MLSSIHPLGERGRDNTWAVTAASYILGSATGGAVMGVVAGTIGLLVADITESGRLLIAASLGALAVGAEIGLLGRPTIHRQVNEDWLDEYRGVVYGFGYGFQLGLGFATIMTTAATHLTIAFAVLVASPAAGLVIGLTFGTTRGLMLLLGRRIVSPGALVGFHRGLQERTAVVRQAVLTGLTVATLVAVLGAATA